MLIITLIKLAIFKSKRNQGRPHLNRFIALLKIEAQKEQLYFRRLKKENAFVQKWGEVAKILTDDFSSVRP